MTLASIQDMDLRRIAVRATRFVLAALLLGTLLAPLAAFVPDDSRTGGDRVALRELLELVVGSTAELTGLSEREAAQYGSSLPIALLAVRAGVALLVLGAVAVGTVGLVLIASAETRHRRLVTVGAVVLLVGSLLLAAGLAVLPFDDGDAGPAWGLWFPLGLAIWVLILHGPVADLDG